MQNNRRERLLHCFACSKKSRMDFLELPKLILCQALWVNGCATPDVIETRKLDDKKLSYYEIKQEIDEANRFEREARSERKVTGKMSPPPSFSGRHFWVPMPIQKRQLMQPKNESDTCTTYMRKRFVAKETFNLNINRGNIIKMTHAKIVFLVVFLTGCASFSVPDEFREKVESSAVEDYFASIDPTEIRIKFTTNHDSPVDIEGIKLLMQIEIEKEGTVVEKHHLEGTLTLISNEDLLPVKRINPFSFNSEHIYIAKLGDDAVAAFKKFQDLYVSKVVPLKEKVNDNKRTDKQNKKPKGKLIAGFGLSAGNTSGKKQVKDAEIKIDIRLSENDDYMPMLRPCLWPFCWLM